MTQDMINFGKCAMGTWKEYILPLLWMFSFFRRTYVAVKWLGHRMGVRLTIENSNSFLKWLHFFPTVTINTWVTANLHPCQYLVLLLFLVWFFFLSYSNEYEVVAHCVFIEFLFYIVQFTLSTLFYNFQFSGESLCIFINCFHFSRVSAWVYKSSWSACLLTLMSVSLVSPLLSPLFSLACL